MKTMMKRKDSMVLGSVCLVAGAVFTAATPAQADVIAFDNFDYPDGSLVPNGGWANHAGTLGTLLVSGGQAMVQHGLPLGEDASLAFASVPGMIFYGINFMVADLGHPYGGTDNEYFAHFRNGFDFSARLDVVEGVGGGDFSVGIATGESTADQIWPTDLSFGVTYRAVVGYDQDANLAQLWIDATLFTDPSILGDDLPDPGDSVTSFALRQSTSSQNELIRVDGLVIGTTFDDVVHQIPAPASLALLGLAGLVGTRRRRA